MSQDLMQKIVSLAKRRGFVYPTSEIYGGIANCYDYGPMGAQLMKNIRNVWWNTYVERRSDVVGLDSQIILHPQTWVASGHVNSFSDPLVEDKVTHKRYRADHLIEEWLEQHQEEISEKVVVENLDPTQMTEFIRSHGIKSPEGNEVSEAKAFNLLFETEIGSVAGDKAKVYLRGETAQGIFTNFKQILDSTRIQLPFGVGQVGKSFRNEVTTGQFVFRTLEFEQGEIEYFFNPETSDWKVLYQQWKEDMEYFIFQVLGIQKDNIRWRQHTDKERSHYSKDTWDVEYKFPFGWKELWGLAYRTDYDLKQHTRLSGQSLEYTDPQTGKSLVPHVIEPAVGINRIFFMLLCDAYTEEPENKRIVLKLNPQVAPYQVAIFPLVKNKEEIMAKALKVKNGLKEDFVVSWDERGNIGKRYFAQDEIGTPFCITVDYDTLENDSVTVRDRDSMKQERVSISGLVEYLDQKLRS